MSERSPGDTDHERPPADDRVAPGRESTTGDDRTDDSPPGEGGPEDRQQGYSAEYDGPLPQGEVPPWKLPEEEWPDPEEDAEDLHPVLDAVADATVYLAIGSLGLAVVGLATLALEYSIPGRTMISVGIGGATLAMMLAAIVGALSEDSVPLTGPNH